MDQIPGMFRTWKDAGRVFGLMVVYLAIVFGSVVIIAEAVKAVVEVVR